MEAEGDLRPYGCYVLRALRLQIRRMRSGYDRLLASVRKDDTTEGQYYSYSTGATYPRQTNGNRRAKRFAFLANRKANGRPNSMQVFRFVAFSSKKLKQANNLI